MSETPVPREDAEAASHARPFVERTFRDRLILIGVALALMGFGMPLLSVLTDGGEERTFSGPDLVGMFPGIWLVPILALLCGLVGLREPRRTGRHAVAIMVAVSLGVLLWGTAQGYGTASAGVSERGFFRSLAYLRDERVASWRASVRRWEAEQEAAENVDMGGLGEDVDGLGDLDDLDDLGDDEPDAGSAPSQAAPERPADPTHAESHFTFGFFLLVLGLWVSLVGALPRAERWIARLEGIALVLLLFGVLGMACYRLIQPTGTEWMDTLARMGVVWIGLVGASLAARERGHIAIELLDRVPSMRLQAWVKTISGLLAVAAVLLLCAAAQEYTHEQRAHDIAAKAQADAEGRAHFAYVRVPVWPSVGRLAAAAPGVHLQEDADGAWYLALDQWLFTLVFPLGLFLIALRFVVLAGQDILLPPRDPEAAP